MYIIRTIISRPPITSLFEVIGGLDIIHDAEQTSMLGNKYFFNFILKILIDSYLFLSEGTR